MEMYQSPCHNYLEPITSIITIIPKNCARIHAPVGTTEASYRTFGYRGIHIWNHISQKKIISLFCKNCKDIYTK